MGVSPHYKIKQNITIERRCECYTMLKFTLQTMIKQLNSITIQNMEHFLVLLEFLTRCKLCDLIETINTFNLVEPIKAIFIQQLNIIKRK